MRLSKRFNLLSNVHPEEQWLFWVMFLHSFLLGFSTSFYFVAANSYFLKKVTITNIPIAYIIAGIIGVFLMGFYRAIQLRAGVASSFIACLVGFAFVSFLLFFFHRGDTVNHPASIYIAYAGFILVFPFSVLFVVGFSGLSLQLFNLSQSKRLSALIGTGEVIASIIGYLLIPFILKLTNNPSVLFIVSGISILLSVIPIRKIIFQYKNKFTFKKESIILRKINWSFFVKEPFFVTIGLVTLFSVLAVYLSDYAYLISVRTLAQLSSIEVSVIISFLFSIIKSGELIFSLLSGNLLSTKGMRFSLLILPCLLFASTLLAFGSYFLMDDVAFFLIAFFLFNKWSERVIRKGLTMPAMRVLYQLAEPSERASIQSSIEGTISQFSIIISGIILLVITRLQTKSDNLYFLYVMSLVSLLAFAVWMLLVSNLYLKYKNKIQAYLQQIRTATTNITSSAADNWLLERKLLKGVNDELSLNKTLGTVIKLLQSPNQVLLEQLIGCYNTAIQTAIDNKDDYLSRKIINAYFKNDNVFNRLLIVAYTEFISAIEKQKFIKEMYDLSDISLRLQLLKTLIGQNFAPSADNRFYFSNLTQSCVEEIVCADAALLDLLPLNNLLINKEIEAYQLTNKNLLLELLKLLFDKKAITVIQEILNTQTANIENQIFAVELLDNILTDELKQTITPLFEPISFQTKKHILKKYFPIYELSVAERLKEIAMKDYKLMNAYAKQLAIEAYHQLTNDTTTLKAFNESSIENLSNTASQLLGNSPINSFIGKQKVSTDLHLASYLQPNDIYYLLRYGLFAKKAKHSILATSFSDNSQRYLLSFTTLDNNKFEIDILGLGLLLNA